MNWFVYILKCSDSSLYTGITTDLARRFAEHRDAKKGAKYTRSRRPVTLVHVEECSTQSEALKREAYIKKLKRSAKEILIKNNYQSVHTKISRRLD